MNDTQATCSTRRPPLHDFVKCSKNIFMKLRLLYAYKHQDIIMRSNPRLQQIHSQMAIILFQCIS
jgi:hypothetical protein